MPIPPIPPLPASIKKRFPEMVEWEKRLDQWRKDTTVALQGPTVFQ
jgi:hypothetical protein